MNLSYDSWMQQVDESVQRRYGISIHDLGDFNSRDLYDDEVDPEEAATIALDEDDLYSMRDF